MYHKHLQFVVLSFLLTAGTLSGCGQRIKGKYKADTLTHDWKQTIPGNFSGQTKNTFDSIQITQFIKKHPKFSAYAGEIHDFYQRRGFAYAWFENKKLIEQANNLASRVLNLQNEGINQPAPYQKELDSLIYNADIHQHQPNIQTELMLTAQYFVFSKLAWQGMDDTMSRSARWYLPRKKVDYQQYLDSLLKETAKSQLPAEPVYRQYDLLRAFLKKYRELAVRGDWSPIVLSAKIRPGDSAIVVPLIKKRLFELDDFHGDTLNRVFTTELQDAVKRFQYRHGLLVDGLLNKATMAELNVPLKSRIEQLIVNMERSRWLPVNLHSDYLGVNIPEFKLHVYHADSLLWSCNVVVGQTVHQTTLFYGEIKYVVFSPYWEVPQSIVRKEIIPQLKKNPDYLATHRMEITGYKEGLPVIRQLPGPENSLGLVKFLFPNNYNTYLHDTPSKSLFGETTRAFSHGCIRVQEPAKLANFLLKDKKGWDAQRIEKAMSAGKEQYVTIENKVPVFITYFTAFIDREQRLNFRKDIYQLDGAMAGMLLNDKHLP
ncbi:L,D-transpeptidase family protein [Mucilaginibacter boryungensis]|uniref:L,D-transpeptidase family protein n=1 Tax=Mucilaginibacter boryungensis TaxID=768480 RepID=A0ABR9XKH0_9SPHI|nr:L,D-transpeptidase family protein [Mucilaginibacter boryungensis]